jgi:thiol-disulfide isomerase/thioredoxin
MTIPGTTGTRAAAVGVALAVFSLAACAAKTPPAATPAPAPPAAAAPTTAPAPAAPARPPETPAAAARPTAPAPAPAPLTGHVTRAALEDYESWKTLRAQDYTPDASTVKTIAERGKDVQVLAIVATWCPDSRREVPRFFKIYDQARLGMGKVTLVAVDRSKKDAEGLTVKYEILRVPTFVFFRGDREIGRVTERAVTTLENDIALIVAK